MTLEITVTETVQASDLMTPFINFFKRLISWFKPVDETVDAPDIEDDEDNKSPPADVQQTKSANGSDTGHGNSPQDLSIQVSDESSAGESFGP